jgi:hypothetical protein
MKNRKYLAGIIIISLGILILLGNANIIDFNIWRIFTRNLPAAILIGLGIMFHLMFLASRNDNVGLVVPGGIFITVGIALYLGMTFNIWGTVWPLFILSVPVGLFELYIFDKREKGLLFPVFILGFIAFVFFIAEITNYRIIGGLWPSLFITLPGLIFHFAYAMSKKENNAGILVPGGILLTIGISMQISHSLNLWHVLWPLFVASPAVGLFELYLFSKKKDHGLLIPVFILGGISAVMLSFTGVRLFPSSIRGLVLPVILVIVGAVVLLKAKVKDE